MATRRPVLTERTAKTWKGLQLIFSALFVVSIALWLGGQSWAMWGVLLAIGSLVTVRQLIWWHHE